MSHESKIIILQNKVSSLRPLAKKLNKLQQLENFLDEINSTKSHIIYIKEARLFYDKEVNKILQDITTFGNNISKLHPTGIISNVLKPLHTCRNFPLSKLLKVIFNVGKNLALEISLQSFLQVYSQHLYNLLFLLTLYETSISNLYLNHIEMNIKLEILQNKLFYILVTFKKSNNGKMDKLLTRKVYTCTKKYNINPRITSKETSVGKSH